ncbi:MAG TPA: efflux RND transporter periplasmic adaptor subunit [Stellaceae bacterium]|jgi:multidrug efflux system membrane fusion protein
MNDQPTPLAPPVAPPPGRPLPETRPPFPPAPPAERPPRRHRVLYLILGLVLIAGAATWAITHNKEKTTPAGRFASGGTMPVGTATVAQGDMPITLSALGTVTPLATITVQTQISGQLIEIGFQEGQIVQKGDFLAQIDPRPYQVALETDQAQLAKDQASLNGAEVDLKRYTTLAAQKSIATQTRDDQVATVAQDRAQVMLDQSNIDTQKLNLAYCRITSPVTGRVGLRQVDQGNYVTPTSLANGIVVVTQLSPISVIFTVPEDNLPQVMKQFGGSAPLQATAYDRAGLTKIDTGQLSTIDNQIDTTTGTVKMRATFDNKANTLFPNQFVNIQLLVDTLKNTEIVPDAAIQRGAPGTFVYVVKPDNTVSAVPVTLGPDDGQKVAVTKGLSKGQVVVIDGADRLKDGAKVTISEPGASGQGGSGGTNPPASTNGQPGQRQHGQGQGQGQGHQRSSQ